MNLVLVPPGIRRKLRRELGSRVNRRAGTKSHGAMKPRAKLNLAIAKWRQEASRTGNEDA